MNPLLIIRFLFYNLLLFNVPFLNLNVAVVQAQDIELIIGIMAPGPLAPYIKPFWITHAKLAFRRLAIPGITFSFVTKYDGCSSAGGYLAASDMVTQYKSKLILVIGMPCAADAKSAGMVFGAYRIPWISPSAKKYIIDGSKFISNR